MKYGIRKKYTRWQFGVGIIVLQLFLGIVLEWVFIKVGGGGYTGKEFFGYGFIRCFFSVLAELFTDKFLRDSWGDHSSTDKDEVRNWILTKNPELGNKLRELEELSELNDEEFKERYYRYRQDLVSYMKTHKLKPWEKDYANWHLNICDKINRNIKELLGTNKV